MTQPQDDRTRTALKRILEDAVRLAGAGSGLLILFESRPGGLQAVTVGFPARADIPARLGYLDGDHMRKGLAARKAAATPAGLPFVAEKIRSGGKAAGLLALFGSRGKAFARDRCCLAVAAREAGRHLDLLADLARLQRNYLNTLESKDPFSRGHSRRVAEYCRKAGVSLGLSAKDLDTMQWAALLHDIGKVGIVDAILMKKDRLTPEEMTIVREHPVIGQRIVQDLDSLRDASLIIRSHHERHDGGGYPDGLSGRNIPRLARILALAEVFDTITSRTPYHEGQPLEEAAAMLRQMKGTQFDPELVDPFLEAILF